MPDAPKSPRRPRPPKPPPDPLALARIRAGQYATGDGRYTVDLASGGWMVTDAERLNELGLPLVRGPFATLEEARSIVASARSGPALISNLADRIAAIPKRPATATAPSATRPLAPPPPLPVVIREFRSRDGDDLRALWDAVDFHSVGDDDMGLRRFAQRNPGLFLVASQGASVVASAMGAWDGRRGWIYHVAVAATHRRTGLAKHLVGQVEVGLRALGCRKINVIVVDANPDGAAFWRALGYERHATSQFGREISRDASDE